DLRLPQLPRRVAPLLRARFAPLAVTRLLLLLVASRCAGHLAGAVPPRGLVGQPPARAPGSLDGRLSASSRAIALAARRPGILRGRGPPLVGAPRFPLRCTRLLGGRRTSPLRAGCLAVG